MLMRVVCRVVVVDESSVLLPLMCNVYSLSYVAWCVLFVCYWRL